MKTQYFICRFDVAVVQYYLERQNIVQYIGFGTLENSKRAKSSKAVGRWLIKKLKTC